MCSIQIMWYCAYTIYIVTKMIKTPTWYIHKKLNLPWSYGLKIVGIGNRSWHCVLNSNQSYRHLDTCQDIWMVKLGTGLHCVNWRKQWMSSYDWIKNNTIFFLCFSFSYLLCTYVSVNFKDKEMLNSKETRVVAYTLRCCKHWLIKKSSL